MDKFVIRQSVKISDNQEDIASSNESSESNHEQTNFNNKKKSYKKIRTSWDPNFSKIYPWVEKYEDVNGVITNNQAVKQYSALCQLEQLQLKNCNELYFEKEPIVLKPIDNEISSLSEQEYASYENPISGRMFLASIAFVIEYEIIQELIDSKNWSILVDESTSFNTKHLAIVAKYLINNKPVLRYLGIIELTNCNAKSITEDLERFIIAKSLNIKNIFHFGSDGASTMLGHRTGIAARLKNQDATEQVLYFKKYDTLVKGIYLYFSSSYKRLLTLKMVQNTLEELELVLLNIVSTCWLSFSNVIHNFHRSLKLVKEALSEEAITNQQAASLLTEIDQEFEIITMFLADYFFIMKKLICIFQSDYVLFTDIQQYITMTVDAIQAQFIDSNEVLPTYAIIESLNNRFPNRELFNALKIFDPEQLPNLDSELSNYGNEEIRFLGDFYGLEKIVSDKKFKPPLNKQLLIKEWGL
ncbi:211_t:CDS:2, partial [Dentiscutata heterogama]